MTGEVDIQLIQNQVGVEFRGKKKADSVLLQLHKKENADTNKQPCLYQYPKKKHVDALLSNMMNELTKIFVRVREYLESENAKVSRDAVIAPYGPSMGDVEGAGDEKDLEKMRALRPEERPPGSRFRVVSGKPQRFFDEIYSNMTQEYKDMYSESSSSVRPRASRDPCEHQEEIKQLWRDLLDASQGSLRRAALRCVRLHLHASAPRARDARVKNKLGLFLLKEFKKLRSLQLDTLCDQFQLCYKDLL